MENSQCINETLKAELKENFIIVRKLIFEDSKNDHVTEPYKSKYLAIEILKKMQNLLLNSIENDKQKSDEVISMLAFIYLKLGILSIETEELKDGQDYLNNCIDVLNKSKERAKVCLIKICALNQLGILWAQRDEVLKAKEYLLCAEKEYKDYICINESNSNPYNGSTLFGIINDKESPSEDIEKLHTLTLYYLAQIFGCSNCFIQSAVYCHLTLKRQLESNDFDSLDWALNCASLSQFFMEKKGFTQARHHLAAATYILEKYENSLKNMTEVTEGNQSEILDSKWENFKYRSADISRCWAKYGILLMSMSRERLLSNNENENIILTNRCNVRPDDKSELNEECFNQLKFEAIENYLQPIAEKITDKYLLDFQDAREVFLLVQTWLSDAQKYFTLENQASEHVQIIQDMSEVYQQLAFFEEDENRQAKMHKKRINLLEGVVKELNEKYYQSVCQQIWIKLGQAYSDILHIKLDYIKIANQKPTLHMITKINNLTKSAIENFTKFLNSLKVTDEDKYSDDMIRTALCTYIHLGRLHNNFITSNKQLQFDNIKKSLNAYTFVVNYCKKYPNVTELMSVELNICKQFVKLLPLKLNKLLDELSNK